MESRVLTFAAGETICTEGAQPQAMHIVLGGRAAVSTSTRGLIGQLGAGDVFDELAVIDSQPCLTTVTALDDDTRILPIDQAHFVYLVSHQPAFSLAIMTAMARRMRDQDATGRPRSTDPVESSYTAAQIRPGLWQLHSRGRSCNVYLVVGHHRTMLVDTGLPSASAALADALRGIGHPIESVDLVVLTHEHADHVGGMGLVTGRAIVAAHPLAANKLALHDDFATVSSVIGETVPPFPIDLWLPDGTTIDAAPFRFDVVHTPGHTSGCLCLADTAQGLVICGDTFMKGGAMGGIFGSGNISDYVLSLQRLRRLRLSTALPGHGRVSDDAESDIATALLRAETLLTDTRELMATMDGHTAFDQIMRSVRDLNR